MQIEIAKHLLLERFCCDWAGLEQLYVEGRDLALELAQRARDWAVLALGY